jgi:hypothetical protein
MGHHHVLRKAGDWLRGLHLPIPVPAPVHRLHPALGSTGFCPLLRGRVGKNSGYAQFHLEVQKVIPGVLKKQVLSKQKTEKVLRWAFS